MLALYATNAAQNRAGIPTFTGGLLSREEKKFLHFYVTWFMKDEYLKNK